MRRNKLKNKKENKMAKNILKSFGEEIKKLRTQQNLSQENLAEETGFHRTYIGMVERGERNISLLNIQKFSKALGIEIHQLFKEIK